MRIHYDFHMHTALSPCGDNEMTPYNLVQMALLAGLNAIAVTDHNRCGNCGAALEAAAGTGLIVLPGMELCTAEEAHVVCLFPTLEQALRFEAQVYPTLPPVTNRPDIFGEQLLLDCRDQVIGSEPLLLTTAAGIRVDEVLPMVRRLGGTAFPAHIDRPSYSVTATLGEVPALGFAALEITAAGDVEELRRRYAEVEGKILLCDSDAHSLEGIPDAGPWLELPDARQETIMAALDGRIPCRWGRHSEE